MFIVFSKKLIFWSFQMISFGKYLSDILPASSNDISNSFLYFHISLSTASCNIHFFSYPKWWVQHIHSSSFLSSQWINYQFFHVLPWAIPWKWPLLLISTIYTHDDQFFSLYHSDVIASKLISLFPTSTIRSEQSYKTQVKFVN
jgi:hypothetical protein